MRVGIMAAGLMLFMVGAGETVRATERAKYSVIESDPPFELRDYPESVVAVVTVEGTRGVAVRSGFRVLANYIFGNNPSKTKIAMTAPVIQAIVPPAPPTPGNPTPGTTEQGTTRPGTGGPADSTPVSRTPGQPPLGNPTPGSPTPPLWQVHFFMPDELGLQSLPTPADQRIHIEKTTLRRMAVIRFSGLWTDANFQSHELRLREWMRKRNWVPQSGPIYAYYDPPWIPWFMRTIEVLFEVAPAR